MKIGFVGAAFGLVLLLVPASASAQVNGYEPGTSGTRLLQGRNGFSVKMLVEEANLGGTEVEIGEITFPAGNEGGNGHLHRSIEIFYILEGRFDHIVNGVHNVLEPGMVGIVRPGDSVIHRVLSEIPVKALVVWAPGGVADGIAGFTTELPIP
jgi:mannose-6-phosphate isomerase-like protein (cupin superfamily)